MSTQRLSVAILGSGPIADLLAQRIGQRTDLKLVAATAAKDTPTQDTDCVIYLPTSAELDSSTAATRITALLRAGFDVISTAPPAALGSADLLAACRTGASTFHGTGGFQSRLITRFNRAFSSITRNIRDVELIEELDVEEVPAHPWMACADCGLDEHDPAALNARARAVESFYAAGMHALSEAVFHDAQPNAAISVAAIRPHREDMPPRGRAAAHDAPEQIVVRRSLGDHVAYDSVWTKREGSSTPLRYRLNTTSDDAIGHVTITFHAESTARPADHLTCTGLLDAIRPVHASAPGILHHDLEINHVKLNACLAE